MNNLTLEAVPTETLSRLAHEAEKRGITVEQLAGIMLDVSVGYLSIDNLDERIDEHLVESSEDMAQPRSIQSRLPFGHESDPQADE